METDNDHFEDMQAVKSKSEDHEDSSALHPGSRQTALIYACFITFGGFYSLGLPISIQTQLQAPPFNLSFTQFNLMFTTYHTVGMITPFLAGLLADNIGATKCLLIFLSVATLGQLFVAMSLGVTNYSFVIAGRLFLSAMEAVIAILNKAVYEIFPKSELTRVLSLVISVGRFGGVAESLISPLLYNTTEKLWVPAVVAALLCILSLLCCIKFAILHKRIKQFQVLVSPVQDSRVRLSDARHFGQLYWVITASVACYFCSLYTYFHNANNFLTRKFGLKNTEAGVVHSWATLSFVLLAPLVGSWSDRVGKKPQFICMGTFLLILGHLTMAYLPRYEHSYIALIPVTMYGISFALYGTLIMACIALAVDPKYHGTAYGINSSIWQLFFAISMTISGKIQDSTVEHSGYKDLMLYLSAIGFLGLIAGLIMKKVDSQEYNSVLARKASHQ